MAERGGRSWGAGIAGAGLATVTFFLAGVKRDEPPTGPAAAAAAAATRDTARASPGAAVRPFDAGTRLVEEFFGAPIPQSSEQSRRLAQWALRGPTTPPTATPRAAPRAAAPPVDFDAIVATVPDPFDSHLDYAYDAHLEAIQLALGDAGYVLDRFWLPQRADTLRLGAGPDAARVPTHERYPGVILFRRVGWDVRSDSVRRAALPADSAASDTLALRLVYLVPEMPTGGVHKDAFRAALAERGLLRRRLRGGGGRDTLHVIGPNFSGATMSIVEVLAPWARDSSRLRPDGDPAYVSVTSGTATSLDRQLVNAADARGVHFATTIHPDALLDAALRCAVLPALRLRREQVLLLIESSTAYGESSERLGEGTGPCRDPAEPDSTRFHIARFPLAVASLRAEYARHPDAEGTAGPTIPGTSAAPRLPIPLAEPTHPRERPATISPLTPPALDLKLAAIVRLVRDERIRAVGLLASDVRDKLFLADELRKRVHDVQLFTYESELLYARPDYAEALRGTLVFSTYPLVPAAQLWSAGPPDWLLAQSDGALGLYNAMLAALGRPELLREYGEPAGRPGHVSFGPPVWLTLVGRGAIAPLTVYADSAWRRPGEANVERRAPALPRQEVGVLPIALVAATAAVVTLVAAWLLGLLLAPGSSHVGDEGADVQGRRTRTTFAVPLLGGAAQPPAAVTRATPPSAWVRWWYALERGTRQRLPGRLGRDLAEATRWSGWDEARAFESVETASLDTHRWLYRGLLLVAYLAFLTPATVLLIRERGGLAGAALGAASVVGWGAALGCLVGALVTFLVNFGPAWVFAWPRPGWGAGRAALWVLEFVARWLVVVLGLGYAVVVLWLGAEMNALHDARQDVFALLFYRAFHLETGVSPLIPLALSAVGFATWCAWHGQRIELLHDTTPFEALCLRYGVIARAGEGEGAAARRRVDPPAGVARAAAAIRTRLFLLVPDAAGVLLLVALAGIAAWFVSTFARTAESTVFVTGRRWPAAFEWLLRFGVVALLSATAWGVYRLLTVWVKLRECLDEVGELPIVSAFERLPPRVSRLTRLSLFSPRSHHVIDAVTAQQRGHLRQIFLNSRADIATAFGSPAVGHIEEFVAAGGAANVPWAEEVVRLERLALVLAAVWRMEPGPEDIAAVVRELAELEARTAKAGEPLTVSTSSRVRRTFTGAAGLWLREAEEYAAVRVVEYAEWVLRHLRRLAGFLLVALLIGTTMLSSYPFQPQSRAKLALVVVLVAGVAALLLVMAQMNRNEVLSRITKTDPGRITWDTGFVVNVLLFAVLPVLALVSSEFPEARTVLFGWVEPLLKAVARS